jgi:hypothetical protein
MGLKIESGAGNGTEAFVTDSGRLTVTSRTAPRIYYQSRVGNRAFSWTNSSYNYSAADTILLVKNTSATHSLVIHSISFSGDATSIWQVHIPTTEVTPTGTSVSAVNLNGRFAGSPEATAIADETNNTQGSIIYSTYLLANTPHIYPDFLGNSVRLGANQSIGVDVVTVGTGAIVTIAGYFELDGQVSDNA